MGAGAFVGFGLKSQATYRDLSSRCGPAACGPAERAAAATGSRDQTIANVGIVVAGVGAVAAAVLVVLGTTPSGAAPAATAPAKRAKLLLGPSVCGVLVFF